MNNSYWLDLEIYRIPTGSTLVLDPLMPITKIILTQQNYPNVKGESD